MVSQRDVAARLRELGQLAGLAVGAEHARRLAEYVALLLRWNERMNLTALRADDEGLARLVVEPLLAAQHIPRGAASLIDVGSGGGSPAIPIKIMRPELFLRMVEAKTRKAAFLREAVRRLNLVGAVVENCRHEDLRQREGLQEAHDILTVRGVRVDGGAAARLQRFVKPGGALLLFWATGQPGGSADAGAGFGAWRRVGLMGASGSELVVVEKGCGQAG